MHVICSVVSIGVVKPVWLSGRASVCKQKVTGTIPGGGMQVRFICISAAPARSEELELLLWQKIAVIFINISLLCLRFIRFGNRIKVVGLPYMIPPSVVLFSIGC